MRGASPGCLFPGIPVAVSCFPRLPGFAAVEPIKPRSCVRAGVWIIYFSPVSKEKHCFVPNIETCINNRLLAFFSDGFCRRVKAEFRGKQVSYIFFMRCRAVKKRFHIALFWCGYVGGGLVLRKITFTWGREGMEGKLAMKFPQNGCFVHAELHSSLIGISKC